MPGRVGGKGMGTLGIDWAITLTRTCMLAIKASKKKENEKGQKKKKYINKKEKKSSVTSSSMLANSFLKWSLYVILHGLETWKFMLSLLRRRN